MFRIYMSVMKCHHSHRSIRVFLFITGFRIGDGYRVQMGGKLELLAPGLRNEIASLRLSEERMVTEFTDVTSTSRCMPRFTRACHTAQTFT